MDFKKIIRFSFVEVVLESSEKNKRSIRKMQHLNKSTNRNHVGDALRRQHTSDTSEEKADEITVNLEELILDEMIAC